MRVLWPSSERALAITPNLALAHGVLGRTLVYSGRPTEGLAAMQTCIRLDPRAPSLASNLIQVAVAHYFGRDYGAAADAAKRVIRTYPEFPQAYRWLATALGQLGQNDEAMEALKKAIPWHRLH